MKPGTPVALCILDGWGLREERAGNAVALADTPNFDWLMENCPNATLTTHGTSVGLSEGTIGNSEVGHLHIGAGRTILMEMMRISRAIDSGEFKSSGLLADLVTAVNRRRGVVHLVGIVSDVGVHGLLSHVVATASALARLGARIVVHAITDGRDSPPGDADRHIRELARELPEDVQIVTVSGRYFAMDRDRRWERVERAWRAIILGEGERAQSASRAVAAAFSRGETDEFIPPTVVGNYGGVKNGDGVFFVNYRSDRMRQIVAATGEPGFDEFDVSRRPDRMNLLGMVSYFDPPKDWICHVFDREIIRNGLGEWVAAHGLRQFRLAETEKFPHVTFFFNGGREKKYSGEKRYMPQSPRVATYDLAPEMAAKVVAERFAKAVRNGFNLIVANFANPDMVGHTGDLSAAIRACEATDKGLGVVVRAMKSAGGSMIVTADHGNCEMMINPSSGRPHTAHTTSPVPVILFAGPEGSKLRPGMLSDLAPTLLELMKLEPPPEMTGRSLLV